MAPLLKVADLLMFNTGLVLVPFVYHRFGEPISHIPATRTGEEFTKTSILRLIGYTAEES